MIEMWIARTCARLRNTRSEMPLGPPEELLLVANAEYVSINDALNI